MSTLTPQSISSLPPRGMATPKIVSDLPPGSGFWEIQSEVVIYAHPRHIELLRAGWQQTYITSGKHDVYRYVGMECVRRYPYSGRGVHLPVDLPPVYGQRRLMP
jgi:hypothetical protein